MNRSSGFSLIEILTIIAIFGLLAAFIFSGLARTREASQYNEAQSELIQIQIAMKKLHDDTGKYPDGMSDICPLGSYSGGGSNERNLTLVSAGLVGDPGWSGWDGPYMTDLLDPWGTPYYLDTDYRCLTNTHGCKGINDSGQQSVVIVSCGPDRDTETGACAYNDDNIVIRYCD